MANLIPKIIPNTSPEAEKKLHEAFSLLGDEWTVLHSVTWQSKRNGREGDGESDFLLVHKDCGILVIEVKGGIVIDIVDGQWRSTSRHGAINPIKNPYNQATDSKHALLKYLLDQGIPKHSISINHAVAFPDCTVDQTLGPAATQKITWDRRDLPNIEAAIKETLQHWRAQASISNAELKRIIHLLAPTLTVRRRMVDEVADINKSLISLTDEQIKGFARLRSQREVLVLGGAGTGKTILAVERARKLQEDGFKVLFTCYNELLCRRIRQELSQEIDVLTYHSLCLREIGKARMHVPYTKDQTWWNKTAPQDLIEAAATNKTTYDAIIIDEGQDFSHEWISSLQLLGKDACDPPIYVFADSCQQLYSRYWEAPKNWTRYELDVNCRNTHQIAEKVSAVFGQKIVVQGVDGRVPNFHEVAPKDIFSFTEKIVTRMLKDEGLSHKQICVLTDDSRQIDTFMEMNADQYPFVVYGKNGIVVETIARFKGLEAEVVVLILSKNSQTTEAKAVIYTGMSRAKSVLVVIGHPENKKTANWN